MGTYIIRRLLLMIPTLIGVTAVVFFVMALSPGGVGGPQLDANLEADAEAIRVIQEYYNKRYHLDDPVWMQYLRWLNQVSPIGFATTPDGELGDWRWLKEPDLGRSFAKERPVLDLYAEALPITITLNVIAVPIVYGIAIISGIYAGRFRGKAFDVGTGVTFLGLWSLPQIWVAVMLIGFLASVQYIRAFPASGLSDAAAMDGPFFPSVDEDGQWRPGWLVDRAHHLVLPVICMVYAGFAVLSKLMRGAVLDNLGSDYVRTARAKGVGEREVLWRHTFRNSLLPLITDAAGILPSLLAGSVIIESIFSIPGMGQLMIEGIRARDRELVLAGALIGGILGLTCIIIADVGYALADPRVSYD